MVNLILISLLFHYIGIYLFKPKMNQFNCGIFGYSGNNFNKYKFNILGLFNDRRGGDSCGVLINNKDKKQLSYGSDKTKLYADFIAAGVKLDFEDVNFALGHCRKASVGGIGHTQAQPVIINNENNDMVFAMIHNGTLVNYKELADKYNVNYSHLETDSQIFAKIVWNVGYKVLEEYDGAGAFIFWDSRDGNNTIKVFKGASLYYENDENLYIERPLFVMKNENSMWFSSIEDSLKFINDENYKIENLAHNTLYTILDGKIIGEDKVDRSKRKQLDKLIWTAKNKSYDGYRDYNDGWDNYGYGYENYWNNLVRNKNNSKNNLPAKKEDPNLFQSQLIDHSITNGNIIKKSTHKYINKIYYDVDGRYKINDKLCNGEYKATPAGYINVQFNYRIYYFVEGVMMKSYFDYLCATEYCIINFGQEFNGEVYPFYLTRYSTTPTPMEWEDEQTGENGIIFNIWDEKEKKEIELNGKFSPYFSFSREVYEAEDGVLTNWYSYSDKNEYIQDNVSQELDKKILDETITEQLLIQMIYENIQDGN